MPLQMRDAAVDGHAGSPVGRVVPSVGGCHLQLTENPWIRVVTVPGSMSTPTRSTRALALRRRCVHWSPGTTNPAATSWPSAARIMVDGVRFHSVGARQRRHDLLDRRLPVDHGPDVPGGPVEGRSRTGRGVEQESSSSSSWTRTVEPDVQSALTLGSLRCLVTAAGRFLLACPPRVVFRTCLEARGDHTFLSAPFSRPPWREVTARGGLQRHQPR